jgi:anaerobic magnesium-protoporphyrin IX monomethyl ester cyclase
MNEIEPHVLVLTGGLLSLNEKSIVQAFRKTALQNRASKSAWFEHRMKLLGAEPIFKSRLEAFRYSLINQSRWKTVKKFVRSSGQPYPPELSEVVLATALKAEGLRFTCLTYSELLADPSYAEKVLKSVTCVFASSTFLRDQSELEPLMKLVKRPHLKVVVGGALASILKKGWAGDPNIDVLAVGYGESLVPVLAAWIRSEFSDFTIPDGATLQSTSHTRILIAPHPTGSDLDSLPTPDWRLPEIYRKTKFPFIHYESVRGCPYRCAFCNYPYLFNDKKFRYKSARKIADDWTMYAKELGVTKIQCLDSLFTMPKPRLVELCNELIARKLDLKWICYARADDLTDEAIVKLMKDAGAIQVQIGVESGDPGQLKRMAKATTVADNVAAIENCRKYGITSIVSLIVGFPGETTASLEATYQFMKAARPDFHFIATFSVRVPGVPILSEKSKKEHGLWTMENSHTVSPYWHHDTMSCGDVSMHASRLNHRLQKEKISLDASVFFHGLLEYEREDRNTLLDFQERTATSYPLVSSAFRIADKWMEKNLKSDLMQQMAEVRCTLVEA